MTDNDALHVIYILFFDLLLAFIDIPLVFLLTFSLTFDFYIIS